MTYCVRPECQTTAGCRCNQAPANRIATLEAENARLRGALIAVRQAFVGFAALAQPHVLPTQEYHDVLTALDAEIKGETG